MSRCFVGPGVRLLKRPVGSRARSAAVRVSFAGADVVVVADVDDSDEVDAAGADDGAGALEGAAGAEVDAAGVDAGLLTRRLRRYRCPVSP